MKIKLNLRAVSRMKGMLDRKEIEIVEGSTISDLLNDLKIDNADLYIVTINQRICNPDAVLTNDDEVTILPPICGG